MEDELDEALEHEEPRHEDLNSLAAQKRARERFHAQMPKIEFGELYLNFRLTPLYLSIVERGILKATSQFYWLMQEQKDDIAQETWLYLLEGNRLPWLATDKELFTLGFYRALNAYSRLHRNNDAKALIVSQMKLPTIWGVGEGGQAEGETLHPQDWEGEVHVAHNMSDSMVDDLNASFTQEVLGLLNKDDRRFLVRYLRKSSAHDPAQRKRAERLRKKLKKAAERMESQYLQT